MPWVKIDRLEEEQPAGWGDGAWGDMAWGGSVGTPWNKISQTSNTWTTIERVE